MGYCWDSLQGQAGKLVWRRHQPWKLQQEAQQPTSQQPHSHNGHQASQRPLQQQGAQAVTLPTHPDVHLTPGTLIRCHPHPRRFYACYTTDWHKAVLHLDHELLVINKPGGRRADATRTLVASCPDAWLPCLLQGKPRHLRGAAVPVHCLMPQHRQCRINPCKPGSRYKR
jgi:hypothetical protein